jgi:hypothetical protein
MLSLQLGNARLEFAFPAGVRLESVPAYVRDIPGDALPRFEVEARLEPLEAAPPEAARPAGSRRQRPIVARDGALWRVFAPIPIGPCRCDEFPTRALIPAILEILSLHGVAAIHASAIIHNGRSVIFAGRSGSGKSTCAHALAESGCMFLADDRVLVWKDADSLLTTPSFERPDPFTRWAGIRPELDPPPPPRRESALGTVTPLKRVFLPQVRPSEPSAVQPASPGAAHAELSACSWAESPPLPASIPVAHLTLGLHADTVFSRLLES